MRVHRNHVVQLGLFLSLFVGMFMMLQPAYAQEAHRPVGVFEVRAHAPNSPDLNKFQQVKWDTVFFLTPTRTLMGTLRDKSTCEPFQNLPADLYVSFWDGVSLTSEGIPLYQDGTGNPAIVACELIASTDPEMGAGLAFLNK